MTTTKKYIFSALAVMLILLALLNPSEDEFLHRLSEEYGKFHSSVNFSEEQLMEIGSSRYSSYLLFSSYEYQFGNIGVRYLGIGGFIFNYESFKETEDSSNGEVQA